MENKELQLLLSLIAQSDIHWNRLDETAVFYTVKALCYIGWKSILEENVTMDDVKSFLNLPCGTCADTIVARLAFSNLVKYHPDGRVEFLWNTITNIKI
jgi:hypothetical protein